MRRGRCLLWLIALMMTARCSSSVLIPSMLAKGVLRHAFVAPSPKLWPRSSGRPWVVPCCPKRPGGHPLPVTCSTSWARLVWTRPGDATPHLSKLRAGTSPGIVKEREDVEEEGFYFDSGEESSLDPPPLREESGTSSPKEMGVSQKGFLVLKVFFMNSERRIHDHAHVYCPLLELVCTHETPKSLRSISAISPRNKTPAPSQLLR